MRETIINLIAISMCVTALTLVAVTTGCALAWL